MGSFFQRKPVRLFLRCFRWCRVTVLLALFLLVAAVTYLHLVGLPDYVKRPLLRHLREQGFQVQFSNMHLGWGPAVVIDNVAFSRADQTSGPSLSAGLAQLTVNLRALLHSRLEVDSVAVQDGRFDLPLSATNGDVLSLRDVRLEVALLSNNVAQLREASASFHGIQILVRAEITDFQSLRNWRFPFRLGQKPNQGYQAPLRRVAEIIRQIQFKGTPYLDLDFDADGRDMNSFRANLGFVAREAATPWGESGKIQMRLACTHLLSSGPSPFAQFRLDGERVATPWGGGSNFTFVAAFSRDASTNFDAAINFAGSGIEAKWESPSGSNYWIQVQDTQWDATLALPSTDLMPASLAGNWRALRADSTWGKGASLHLSWQARRDSAPALPDPAWGAWHKIQPYSIDWQATATEVTAPKLQIDDLALQGRWRAPQMTLQKLQAQLYHGHLDGQADLDVASREVRLQAALDFDPHRVSPLLTPAAQRWISQFDWARPPRVQCGLRLVLPPWANRPEDWKAAFRSSIALAGDFTVGPASYRGVPVDSAASHVTYTNRVWSVPGLRAKRAEGEMQMDYTGNEETHQYYFMFDSNLDPDDVLDWLPPAQQRLLGEVKFSKPPAIHAQAWGHWRNPEIFGFSATVAATNFAVRGQSVDTLGAQVEYTNHILRVIGLHLAKNGGALSVPLLAADFAAKSVVVTNVESTLDPGLLGPALGTNTPAFLNRLYFETPPSIRASGSFAWNNPLATDLNFLVQGQNFHWTNLAAETISGAVHWLGRDVAVTNIEARLYKTGALTGWITFGYVPKHGSGFSCDFTARDIDLPALANGLTGRTNKLEGLLDGRLTLDSLLSTDKNALTGRGYVHVHNALLWDIKIFGIFSPVLNLFSPGAGNSRAREASAIFIVTNGAVSTDDLEINATGFRLLYRGKATMNKQIDAKVEADLLRDTPVLGPFLSLMLTPLSKLFEYHVSGSLQNPVIEPLYIPKSLMMLLRPFHTLRSILPESPPEAPPAPPAAPR
jgi:hypothetical protein